MSQLFPLIDIIFNCRTRFRGRFTLYRHRSRRHPSWRTFGQHCRQCRIKAIHNGISRSAISLNEGLPLTEDTGSFGGVGREFCFTGSEDLTGDSTVGFSIVSDFGNFFLGVGLSSSFLGLSTLAIDLNVGSISFFWTGGTIVDFGGEIEAGLEDRRGDFGVVVAFGGDIFSLESFVDNSGDFGVVVSFGGETLSSVGLVGMGGDLGVVVAFGGDISASLGFEIDGGFNVETVLADGFACAGTALGVTVAFDGETFSAGLISRFVSAFSIGFDEDGDPSDLTSRSGSSFSSTNSVVFLGVTSSTLTLTSSTSGVPSLPPRPLPLGTSFFGSATSPGLVALFNPFRAFNIDIFNSSSLFSLGLSCTLNPCFTAKIPSFKGSENSFCFGGALFNPDLIASNFSRFVSVALPPSHFGFAAAGGDGVGDGFKVSLNDCDRGISFVGGVTTLFSNAVSRASTLFPTPAGKDDEVGVIPVTSRRPPLAPNADVKLVLLTIPSPVGAGAAVRLATPGWVGTEGGMGRMELVRLGGEPGSLMEGVFWRAESSQEDFVGDQRFRERESVEVELGRCWGEVVGDLGPVGGGEEMEDEGIVGEDVWGGGDLSSNCPSGGVLWGGGIGICSSTMSSGSGDGSFMGVGSSIGLGSGSLKCGFFGLRLLVEVTLPPKLRWCPVRAYIVAGRALISLVPGAGVLETVELRFNAADATKEPAPRVEVGIIHGIVGFDGELD